MIRKLFLGAVISIAATGTVLAQEGKQIKYRDLPADVKETVDKERRNHELKRIEIVEGRNRQDFYRVIIDEKGNDRVIRVGPTGRLLSEQDVRDVDTDRRDDARTAGAGLGNVTGKQIKYRDLPEPVQQRLDRIRGNREVNQLWEVKGRGTQDFYRAVVDTRGGDKVYRIAPDGRLLTTQELREDDAALGVKRNIRLGRGETDGQTVDFDRLPGEVKTAIGKHAKADEIQEVIRYRSGGKTVYRAEVGEGKFTRFVRVDEDGRSLGVRGDPDPGEAVRFDRLPGEVKGKIGALAKSGQVEEVIKYDRGNRTYYQAEVQDDRGRSYFYTVDDRGREVDLPIQ